jgi:hypothetical protein
MAFQPKPQLSLVPAAALGRPDPELVQQSDPADSLYAQPAVEAIITGMIDGYGGREGLLTELLVAPELPPALLALLTFSFDPRFADQPFGYLCAKAQISPGDVFLAFRDVLAAKATIQAMHESSKELLAMLKELVRSAISHEDVCADCRGEKVIPNPKWKKPSDDRTVPCMTCYGHGTIQVKPDKWAQEKVLDLVGLTRKSAPQFVNNNLIQQQTIQQTAVMSESESPASISGGLPQIQQALSTILFAREVVRPTAVEILEATPAPVTTPDPPPLEGSLLP